MKTVVIETKEDKVLLKVQSRKDAWVQYFRQIVEQKVPLKKIGQIINMQDGKETYPFRTVPSLWLLNMLSEEQAIANIMEVCDCTKEEASKILMESAKKDKWVAKEILKSKFAFPPLP